jgi:ubiquinone/menaquinone biosynthesis C-methylase UbiE
MDNWNEIWTRKAQEKTDDLKQLDGYEGTDFDAAFVVSRIVEELQIPKGASLLEVGCGAGALAVHLSNWVQYVGCDKSLNMVNTFKKHNPGLRAVCCSANNLPFKDKSFDYVIMYSVAQYFCHYGYFIASVGELERTAKKAVFIGDLVGQSKRDSHLIFSFKDPIFKHWNMSDGYYTADRFNIWRDV